MTIQQGSLILSSDVIGLISSKATEEQIVSRLGWVPQRDVFYPTFCVGGMPADAGQVSISEYARIGPIVIFNMSIRASVQSGSIGSVTITGMPFPCWSHVPHPIGMSEWSGISGTPSASILGGTVRFLKGMPNGVSPDLDGSDLSSSVYIAISGLYGALI